MLFDVLNYGIIGPPTETLRTRQASCMLLDQRSILLTKRHYRLGYANL